MHSFIHSSIHYFVHLSIYLASAHFHIITAHSYPFTNLPNPYSLIYLSPIHPSFIFPSNHLSSLIHSSLIPYPLIYSSSIHSTPIHTSTHTPILFIHSSPSFHPSLIHPAHPFSSILHPHSSLHPQSNFSSSFCIHSSTHQSTLKEASKCI